MPSDVALTTPAADTWRKVRRLMPPCRKCLFMDSPLVGVWSCCLRPFPPGRRRTSGLPTRPLLPDEEKEHVDQDAEDGEDQDDREELRHLDHRGIGGQPVAETEAAANHLGADRGEQPEDRADHQADE